MALASMPICTKAPAADVTRQMIVHLQGSNEHDVIPSRIQVPNEPYPHVAHHCPAFKSFVYSRETFGSQLESNAVFISGRHVSAQDRLASTLV